MQLQRCFLFLLAGTIYGGLQAAEVARRPNIVLILADDMGYSDIGCYGGEILTPNLDRLAANGLRFTQFYNTARCSPTRAALMTGLHPHQAGLGILAEDPGAQAAKNAAAGYTRFLNGHCRTMAELLRPAGYKTYMAGKWHLGYHGREKWPLQRGFDRFYGITAGACSYFQPKGDRSVWLDDDPLPVPSDTDYYTTDAFTTNALRFLDEHDRKSPFFLYLAFNAPHWPLHARSEDIERFVGKYRDGWDQLRQRRHTRMIEMGIVDKAWPLSPRDDGARAWNNLTADHQEQLDYRMAVYAAQVHRMDWNIGRLVENLRASNLLEDTLILFLSDNGGCAEPYNDLGGGEFANINQPEKSGVGLRNGSSYGQGWANASNTPFRKFKSMLHEGGIATPLIAHWPNGLETTAGSLTPAVGYLTDIVPTALEVSGATYPAAAAGETLYPIEGRSLVSVFKTGSRPDPEWMFWEQYENRAVRHGKWKAVRPANAERWELYDLVADRTELNDLSDKEPDVTERLVTAWNNWARTHHVLPKTTDDEAKTSN